VKTQVWAPDFHPKTVLIYDTPAGTLSASKERTSSRLRKFWLIPLGIIVGIAAVLIGLWLLRAQLAARIAESYFHEHGIESSVRISRLGLSGVAGSIALGPSQAPDFSAEAIEADFDPLSMVPRLVEVRLVHPVVRARLGDNGAITLPSLQSWLNSLQSGAGRSRYVSDDLAISLAGLHAFLVTPGGAVELTGDIKLRHNALVAAGLAARPAMLAWQGVSVRLMNATLKVDAVAGGYNTVAHFQASVENGGFAGTDMAADFSAPLLKLDVAGKSFAMPAFQLKVGMARFTASGLAAANPSLVLQAEDVQGNLAGDFGARIALRTEADFQPGPLALPLLSRDRKLTASLRENLRHLDLSLKAGIARRDGEWRFSLNEPADIRAARGAVLHLASFALSGRPSNLTGNLSAALSGPGLPVLSLSAPDVRWQDGAFSANTQLHAHFDFDMLHGADIAANGAAGLKDGVFTFRLASCAPVSLSAFHPGASDLAQNIKGAVCPAPGVITITAGASGWTFTGLARDTAMAVPLGNLRFEGGEGRIAFAGSGAAVSGSVAVTAARMHDGVNPRRFEPLAGTGMVTLKNWTWLGEFKVADGKNNPLGTASFRHAMASGEGALTLDAPRLQFASGKLQPTMLSPLLGSVTRAQGAARFTGVVTWTPEKIESHGDLAIEELDFLTPLGTAHALNTKIALTSLLPPATAPGQHLSISRVDWTLPLSGIALDFSYDAGKLALNNITGGISEGNVRLGALTVNLSGRDRMEGTASLNAISLAPLIAASNLSGKIKLDGKVTGAVPFSFGPEGFRIMNGHVAALGPGRLSLDRSVWEAGGATAANAVQDLAYQAMENIAYDQLSADLNSIAGGRLQVVFHVKGHSDPPKPQQAEIAVTDILNGSALQKPIALPSNTPIDLTLDTTLNFDELLNSYADAWSKAMSATLGGHVE
jgi:hypothetical protein